jgi:hypothetical protein
MKSSSKPLASIPTFKRRFVDYRLPLRSATFPRSSEPLVVMKVVAAKENTTEAGGDGTGAGLTERGRTMMQP